MLSEEAIKAHKAMLIKLAMLEAEMIESGCHLFVARMNKATKDMGWALANALEGKPYEHHSFDIGGQGIGGSGRGPGG